MDMTRKSRTGIAILLAVVLFGAFNVVVNEVLYKGRFDLTREGLYTLSDGTRSVLSNLDEPITISLYYSEKAAVKYPSIFAYGNRVKDLLREFEALAGGKIDLRIIDPEPFTDDEDGAVAAGISGIPTSSGESLYLGMVANDTTDRESVVPFFNQERETFLEYDLTKTVAALAAGSRSKVALLTTLPMQFGTAGIQAFSQGRSSPWVVYDQLNEFFEVQQMAPGFDAIPEETDVLMLAHPGNLSDEQLYVIDQFVLGGGRVIAFLDPYAEVAQIANAQAQQAMQMGGGFGAPAMVPGSSDLKKLLNAWGVNLADNRVVADFDRAQKVNMGGSGINAIKDYLPWLAFTRDDLAEGDIVTGTLPSLYFGSAGAFETLEGATTEIEPLARSSVNASLIDSSKVQGQPDPDQLMRETEIDGVQHVIAARISGFANSAFPDGLSGAAEADGEVGETETAGEGAAVEDASVGPGHLANSTGPINVIVVADADLLDDRFWVQAQDFFGQRMITPIAGNGSFVINAVDNLGGTPELIGLRSRGVSQKPFDVVEDLRRDADARFLAEEQALQERVQETERQISELETGTDNPGGDLMNAEQEAALATFREDLVATRRQLREVQRNLRRDIDGLKTRLAMINILAMPALLILAGIGILMGRSRRQGA